MRKVIRVIISILPLGTKKAGAKLMGKDCEYFCLRDTVLKIWRENDNEGKKNLFVCLFSEKEKYFRRVIYKNGKVHETILREHAETAFIMAWEALDKACTTMIKENKYPFKQNSIKPYFYTTFKNIYLKLTSKELLALNAEHAFEGSNNENDDIDEKDFDTIVSEKVKKVLDALGEGRCKRLLIWRYVEKLDYDEIVKRFGEMGEPLSRPSAIKIMDRCKKRFRLLMKSYRDSN